MTPADPFGLIDKTIDGSVRVEKVVGEGGFGVVYRGQHADFGEAVAVKVVKLPAALSAADREAFLTKFRLEAKILYKLSSATFHVVRVISVGSVDSPRGWAPYCVLEWLDGKTLEAELLERRQGIASGRLEAGRPLADLIERLDQIVQALHHAHELGVVHRDIKPANVFVAHTSAGASSSCSTLASRRSSGWGERSPARRPCTRAPCPR